MKPTTHVVDNEKMDRAILVSLVTQEQKKREALAEYSLQELVQLAETAGVEVLATMTQNKESADTKWFIGKGKVEELRALMEELGANTAIFDQELSGAQVRNLEEALDAKIIDRTQLILDIFAQRAKTREGIIQVELAQLSYLLPRLSGQGKNLSRLGGGIGTRGPGETKLETDRRHIRERIGELKAQLEEVVRHRKLHRERRKKSGVFQVALVGYTNAGKSTLLRQLTNADVYVENQLFATLDPTSRTLTLPSGKEIVLTDTVGFIQNLPHDLVAAFRATLEEANEADLILHVVDSSTEMRNEQMRVVAEVLEELGAHRQEQLTVFNKIDLLPDEQQAMLFAEGDFIKMSAYREDDLQRLRLAVQDKLMGERLTFRIPADKGELISLVYRIGDVLENEVDGEEMLFQVRVNKDDYAKMGYLLAAYDQHKQQYGQEDKGESF
ncbi:GTPase HflX [Paenibacillus athensensis]|uniref:GTPase HflX n=1 Tax=Paenibacillus athensensis TaxID=1967502 RepID=A0A4Y8Q818_9BACL|nr:GTPase HflX [Paenibacillus athensensis]MCD1257417.1 GTPase HflX [Paenibacillus athensensis]